MGEFALSDGSLEPERGYKTNLRGENCRGNTITFSDITAKILTASFTAGTYCAIENNGDEGGT